MKINKTFVTMILLFISQNLFSQQTKINWDNWNWLIGDWIGEGSGQPGQGSGTFSFKFDLDKNIIVRRSHSEYPAKNDKPATIHDDLLIVYLDKDDGPTQAIYFDNENHVINYTVKFTDQSIIFTSKEEQNVPIFRLSYTLLEDGYINIKFEMSQDGEKFMTYIEGKSKKIKS